MAVKPTAPGTVDPPLRSLGQTAFVARAETWFTWVAGVFYSYIVDAIDYISATNTDVQAAAVAANVDSLPLSGLGGLVLGVNVAEDGFEAVEITEYTVTPYAETLLDDADAASARATLGLGSAAVANISADADFTLATTAAPTRAAVSSYVNGLDKSLGASGYTTLPGGLIVQWGPVPSIADDADTVIMLPIAFTTEAYGAQATPSRSSKGATNFSVLSVTAIGLTSITIENMSNGPSTGGYYLVYGV